MEEFIVNFNETGLSDAARVGMKIALLGEMLNHDDNIPIPAGFALTMDSYRYYLQFNKLQEPLRLLMENLTEDNLEATGLKARQMLMTAKFPPKLESAIIDAYRNAFDNPMQEVAVRTSVAGLCGDDEFGGYDSHLNIKGNIALAYAIRCCFASVYSDRAIAQRNLNGLPHDVAVAIGIQQMVRSDLAGSGIAQIDTENHGTDDTVTIQSVWGLGADKGETIIPDEHTISCGKDGTCTVVKKLLGDKSSIRVYNEPAAGINTTTAKITPPELRVKFVLDDAEAIQAAQWAVAIRKHFKNLSAVKWAKDGLSNKLYIVGIGLQITNIHTAC